MIILCQDCIESLKEDLIYRYNKKIQIYETH